MQTKWWKLYFTAWEREGNLIALPEVRSVDGIKHTHNFHMNIILDFGQIFEVKSKKGEKEEKVKNEKYEGVWGGIKLVTSEYDLPETRHKTIK